MYRRSVGTGLNPTYIEGDQLDWGFGQWAKPLIQLMIEGVMGVADYQCARLLSQRYHRLAPTLPKPVGLDEWRKTDELIRYASRAPIAKTVRWIKTHFNA